MTLLGRPWESRGRAEALDCWGLVIEAGRELGIEIPEMPDEAYQQFEAGQSLEAFAPPGWSRVECPEVGDVVAIGVGGVFRHAGIVTEPGLVLSSDVAMGARLLELRALRRVRDVIAWRVPC